MSAFVLCLSYPRTPTYCLQDSNFRINLNGNSTEGLNRRARVGRKRDDRISEQRGGDEEAVTGAFERSEESHEESQAEQQVSGLRSEPGIPEYEAGKLPTRS